MRGTFVRRLCIQSMRILSVVVLVNLAAIWQPGWVGPDHARAPVQAAGNSVSPDLSQVLEWYYQGDQQGAQFGYSVSTAGDLNHDGYDDIVFGAPIYDNGIDNEGAVFVFYGSPAGLGSTPNVTLSSRQKGARFGCSVGTAGDVNGDGYDDLLVGADEYNDGQSKEGRVYLFYGAFLGVETTPAWTLAGGQKDAHLGHAVGPAGDVNGDGFDDLIVGAPQYDNGELQEGRAYVFYGSEDGPVTTTPWSAESDQASALFGAAVGTAGDVDDDGYDDIIVGAPGYSQSQDAEGAVFLYRGTGDGLEATPAWMNVGGQAGSDFGGAVGTAGDVNGDGYDDFLVGAPHYTGERDHEGAAFGFYGADPKPGYSANWMAEGDQEYAGFGISVAAAGDVNRDGYDDVVVGAYRFTADQSEEGAAFVFHGSEAGLRLQWGWRGGGNKADTEFGFAVGTAGDVNGDTVADLVVGAPAYRYDAVIMGRVFGYYGPIDEPAFRAYLPLVVSARP
jgi:hypothetical protein